MNYAAIVNLEEGWRLFDKKQYMPALEYFLKANKNNPYNTLLNDKNAIN